MVSAAETPVQARLFTAGASQFQDEYDPSRPNNYEAVIQERNARRRASEAAEQRLYLFQLP